MPKTKKSSRPQPPFGPRRVQQNAERPKTQTDPVTRSPAKPNKPRPTYSSFYPAGRAPPKHRQAFLTKIRPDLPAIIDLGFSRDRENG